MPNTTLAPWWDDLIDDNTSTVTYNTTGTAPNRVFTVEWYRVKAYYTQSNTRITFQVKLFETSNEIQFLYGTCENVVAHNSNESASIGIEDATGGLTHFIEATTGSMTVGVSNLVTPNNWPTVNYKFTPPPKTQTFYNVSVNKNNATLVNQADVIVNGSLTITP